MEKIALTYINASYRFQQIP